MNFIISIFEPFCYDLQNFDTNHGNHLHRLFIIIIIKNNITVADPGFPVGGIDLRRGHFLLKMYAKTKELGSIGGNAGHTPLDPPMYYYILTTRTTSMLSTNGHNLKLLMCRASSTDKGQKNRKIGIQSPKK